jgi:hypothetical protein
MAVHSPLNAFSFDISLIEIGQEIKLLDHLKKNWITCIIVLLYYVLDRALVGFAVRKIDIDM